MHYTLRDALMGGPGHDGYVWMADTYCVRCGQATIKALWPKLRDGRNATMDEWDFMDGDTVPQPIFFGEHDRAVHCADCGDYMYGGEEWPK
jgi:hypothetical protein